MTLLNDAEFLPLRQSGTNADFSNNWDKKAQYERHVTTYRPIMPNVSSNVPTLVMYS